MARTVAIGCSLCASAIAWGGGLAVLEGTEFSPSESAIARVIELAELIPANAELDSATFAYWPPEARDTRRIDTYWFSWPTDDVVNGVRFHRKAMCNQAESNEPACEEALGPFAEWNGSVVGFGGFQNSATKLDLTEILQESDRLIPDALQLVFISLASTSERGNGSIRIHRYWVQARGEDGDFNYKVRSRCSDVSNCEWAVTSSKRVADSR